MMFSVHKNIQLFEFLNFSKILQLCPKLDNFLSKSPSSKYQEKANLTDKGTNPDNLVSMGIFRTQFITSPITWIIIQFLFYIG